jgi:hypothetical protein
MPEPRLHKVGTLVYSRGALIQVMFWLLWGDFFFQLMESLPSLIPLQLRWEGASDSTLGWLSSLPPFIGFFLFPVVGVQSDRHRGPLGRRRPFLLWCTAPVVLGLVLLGAAKPAGRLVHEALLGVGIPGLTVAGCTIAWIALCVVIWVVFNAYIVQVFSCLVADVIPREVLGTYYGLYRGVGALGSLVFNRWILGWAETHTFHVYLLVAVLYATAFYLIVWQVKEGGYPPPPPKETKRGWRDIRRYFRECFSHPMYVSYYVITFFVWGALVPLGYLVFFGTKAGQLGYADTLGLTLQQFGEVKGWTLLITIPIYFVSGPFIDRFHPLRCVLVGLGLVSVSYFCGYWFVQTAATLQIWWCVNQCAMAVYLVAVCALAPIVFPREQYGQFISANTAFGFISLVFLNPMIGHYLESVRDYRRIFVLCGTLTGLAAIACLLLIRYWQQRNGMMPRIAWARDGRRPEAPPQPN